MLPQQTDASDDGHEASRQSWCQPPHREGAANSPAAWLSGAMGSMQTIATAQITHASLERISENYRIMDKVPEHLTQSASTKFNKACIHRGSSRKVDVSKQQAVQPACKTKPNQSATRFDGGILATAWLSLQPVPQVDCRKAYQLQSLLELRISSQSQPERSLFIGFYKLTPQISACRLCQHVNQPRLFDFSARKSGD